MQESLFNTVQKLQTEQKVNVEELEIILNSDIEEVVSLCKKACLKPKTDSIGNVYFTREDVGLLKKMKELYSQTQSIRKSNVQDIVPLKPKSQAQQQTQTQQNFQENEINTELENINQNNSLTNSANKIDVLTRAKNRLKTAHAPQNILENNQNHPLIQFQNKLENFEENLMAKFSSILSEKMDGFDEIIVELIRSKTENESLRQQVNSLNKQIYILKNELASYYPTLFGLYTKKETTEEI